MWTLGFLILLSLSLGVGTWLLFVWSVKSGQYEDPEGPKYRMLEEDEPAPAERGKEPRAPGAGRPGR
ncbi:MAG: cbb3-type cytochrome oxidase assembly protein CcoS [Deltaproteobacteria bacterium]|nr:cbb3-type cytochrome oxidase assembly protein CcoS [Deltaproteobacteria bacterium]